MTTVLKSTRFMLAASNKTLLAATTLINGNSGTYSGCPAKSEDAQYPMTNLKVNDRYSPWRSAPALSGTYTVEWDLGADYPIDVVGVHGFRHAAGATSPVSFDFAYRTAAEGYSFAGAWTLLKSGILLPAGVRDAGLQVEAPRLFRYGRFTFVVGTGGGFSVGNFVIGQVTDDLEMICSPGAPFRPLTPAARVRTMTGGGSRTVLGDQSIFLTLPFGMVDTETRDTLKAIADQTGPFTYISHVDEFRQAISAVDEYEYELAHVYGAERWNFNLPLELLA